MTADLDIWRAAKLLLDQFGEDAALVAARRCDEALARGDMDGRALGLRILAAVEELARQQLRPSDVKH